MKDKMRRERDGGREGQQGRGEDTEREGIMNG